MHPLHCLVLGLQWLLAMGLRMGRADGTLHDKNGNAFGCWFLDVGAVRLNYRSSCVKAASWAGRLGARSATVDRRSVDGEVCTDTDVDTNADGNGDWEVELRMEMQM